MLKKKWSREIVVVSIQKIYESGGKLNSNYAQRHRRKLYLAACVYMGSWREAIEAAGIPYNQVKVLERPCPKWGKEKILLQIQALHRAGRPVNSNYVQLHGTRTKRLYHSAVKYFGGWKQAVEAAGLDYSEIRLRTFRCWSKTAIAKVIQERSRQGLTLAIYREDRGLYHAAKRYLGSWKKALRFAGIDPRTIPDPRRMWTKDRVREEILALHKKDIPLNHAALKKSGHVNLMSAACVLFGSWRKAIRFSGLRYADVKKIRIRWWTQKRVIYMIKRLEKAKISLSSKAVQRSHGGLFAAALSHFGSWSQAVETAGYDYALHSKVWSSKAWVRKLTTDDLGKIDRQSLEMSKIRERGGGV